ncbi:hypothetical protein GC176_11855 [bacterium]|nr:hypothetical protein [bacterium]
MISFSSPQWWIPAILLLVVAALLVGWAAKRGRLTGQARLLTVGCKLFALALLALCLIEPVWSGTHPKPHSNLFVLLADNSRSLMAEVENGDRQRSAGHDSLAKKITAELAPRNGEDHWLDRLAQDFELHEFSFDRRLQHLDMPTDLKWDGPSSALKSALRDVSRRFAGRPTGGILLLSDGNATDVSTEELTSVLNEIDELPPVYPVVFPEGAGKPDVLITTLSVSETPFEDAPVTVQCDAEFHGLAGLAANIDLLAECRLLNSKGESVAVERQPVDRSSDVLAFRLQFRPVVIGVAFYRAVVSVRDLSGDREEPLDELTLINNSRIVQIQRGSTPKRILYLSGRPNWEFKFLRRSLEDDQNVDLMAMIRVAKREAKFDFRGRDGQSSNSLFRGFKSNADEETERFDDPVLVRINTKTPEELRGGFPQDKDELFQFDALILDDIEASFFTTAQLMLIEKFVSERGGGFLMLGGTESFLTGDYDRTPVADLLPVYLDRAEFPAENESVTLDLTREGWLQPWVRLRSTESEERTRLSSMPGFRTINPSHGIKPGASVLSTVSDQSGAVWPALVTQQYGRGRAGAVMVGDLWRWQLRNTEDHPDDLARAWRQTLRWLVADVPQRVDVQTLPAPDVAPEAVRIRVRVTDQEYSPLDNARVEIAVRSSESPPREAAESSERETSGDGIEVAKADRSQEAAAVEAKPETLPVLTLNAEAALDEGGVYTAVFVPQEPGTWTLTASALTADSETLDADETGVMFDPEVDEFRHPGLNRELLEQLAERTGGEVVEAERLDDFVSELQNRPAPVMTTWTMPLWDQPYVFLVVLGCLLGEWGLRRTKGLP